MKKVVFEKIFSGDDFQVSAFWLNDRRPFRLNCHPECEFHFIKQGRGLYWINGRNYAFGKNTCLFIHPGAVHGFASSMRCRRCLLLFAPAFLPASCVNLPCQAKMTDREADYLEAGLNRIIGEKKAKAPFWKDICRAELNALLLMMLRKTNSPQTPSREHRLVLQLAACVEKHFQAGLRISAIAEKFGYSQGYLTAVFAKTMGIGLKHYILQRRIIEAKKILAQNPAVNVAAVSESLGFADNAVFERAFKMMEHMTPSAYRRKAIALETRGAGRKML
ncbi:MAG: AraC family transcriptional regulator [Kiritimatiellae bacterium]|nr:AraC family transcriptional regulator [Kiritimatiellia bacterium]